MTEDDRAFRLRHLRYLLDETKMPTTKLNDLFGGSGRRSDVLNGKRALSKAMAIQLRKIGIPDMLLLNILLAEDA